MGQRTTRSEKSSVRLIVRKETLRRLQTLDEVELRGVAGGQKGPPPPPPPVPSHVTC